MINRFVAFVCCLLVSVSAAAADYRPSPSQWQYGSTGWKTTAEAACKMRSATVTTWVVNPSYYVYECHMTGWPASNLNVLWACSYGGNLLTDPARNNEKWCIGGSGPPPVDPPPPGMCSIGSPGHAGDFDVTTGYATGPSAGSGVASKVVPDGGWPDVSFCVSNCTIKPSGNPDSCHISKDAGPNGYYKMFCTGGFEHNGSECTIGPGYPSVDDQTPEPSSPNSSPDGKCPAGSVASGQDSFGMTICVGTAKPPTPPTTTTEKPPVTTQNPDGGSTTTKESTSTNADGSTTKTTTTTTTAADGTKTTTVDMQTSPRPTGEAGTEDKPEDKSDLCKQNPHLNVCKNSQVMGTCGQVTCSGDAIQCATLRAAAAMECKQRADQEEIAALPATSLGAAIAAGTDPMQEQIDAALNGTTVDLSSPNLDQNGFIGGGSCFPNKTMHFGSQAITIDFSSVCEDIQPLRYAVLSVSLIMAYLIVSKSILGA